MKHLRMAINPRKLQKFNPTKGKAYTVYGRITVQHIAKYPIGGGENFAATNNGISFDGHYTLPLQVEAYTNAKAHTLYLS